MSSFPTATDLPSYNVPATAEAFRQQSRANEEAQQQQSRDKKVDSKPQLGNALSQRQGFVKMMRGPFEGCERYLEVAREEHRLEPTPERAAQLQWAEGEYWLTRKFYQESLEMLESAQAEDAKFRRFERWVKCYELAAYFTICSLVIGLIVLIAKA